ncbi:MAG: hypothetical protein QOJ74_2599 [Ilumatobacteraceae bacterium]|nr:hypothetical protein [Ilumatobacteraceae bacterium]
MTLVISVAAVALLIAIGLIAYARRPRQDAGLTSFRRHIDALSPESRREIMDRVRPSNRGDERPNDVGGRDAPDDSGAGSGEPTD